MTAFRRNNTRKLWPFAIVLLMLLSIRTRIRLADCYTMLSWGITVDHSAENRMSACATSDANNVTDVWGETATPSMLEEKLSSLANIEPTAIPKILHQSYSSTKVPNAILPFIKSWHVGLGDDWTFVWWTDTDLKWFMHTYYPEYAATWEGMPHVIMKADVARYFLLHHYGGVYADMDIEYLQNASSTLSDYLQQARYDANNNNNNDDIAIIFHECTDNSLMASTPNATFWLQVFRAWNQAARDPTRQAVHQVSGIDMLANVCKSEESSNHLEVRKGDFDYHHGTNIWRWKTKRNDFVRILDGIIVAYVVCCGVAVAVTRRRYRVKGRVV